MKKMSEKQFNAIAGEYATSKRNKVETLHELWRLILSEFTLTNVQQVEDWLFSNGGLDRTAIDAMNGRVASLNVTLRKMATLSVPRNPEFVMSSQNHQNESIATILEHAFAEVKQKIGWDKEHRRAAMDGLMFGIGVIKRGLSSQYMYGETAWADDVPKGNDVEFEIDEDMPYGPTTEYQNYQIQDEFPTIKRVSPVNIFFSPGARNMDEVRRIYHRSRRCLADVKRDIRYDTEARKLATGIKGSQLSDEDVYLTDIDESVDSEGYYIDVVECFDLSSRQFCVFSENISIPLRDWTPFGLPIDSPFEFLIPIEHPEYIFGIPYALIILTQALSKNVLRMKLIDQISRNGKSLNFYDKDRIPDIDFPDRCARAVDGEYIPVSGLSTSPGDIFKNVKFGGGDAEILKLMSLIEGDYAEMSGLTDAARNTYTGGDQTATEASQRQQQQGLTTEAFVILNEEFQEANAAAVCQVMLAEWPDTKMVKITGPTPESIFWVDVERRRVLSNFSIKIVSGSTERMDKNTMRRQWMEMLPHFTSLADRAQMDQQAQMQGQPPAVVNYHAMMEETIRLFNPTLAHKILTNRSSADLAMRLMRNYGMAPIGMSPQLVQQIRTMAQQSMNGGVPPQAPGALPSQPASAAPIIPGGQTYQDMGGNVTGRTMSEAVGV